MLKFEKKICRQEVNVQYSVFKKNMSSSVCFLTPTSSPPPTRQRHMSSNAVMPQKMLLWGHRPFVFSLLHYCLAHCFSFLRSTWEKIDISFYMLIEWYCNIQFRLHTSTLIISSCCAAKLSSIAITLTLIVIAFVT